MHHQGSDALLGLRHLALALKGEGLRDDVFKAEKVILMDDHSEFTINYNGKVYQVVVPVPGNHFVLNALVAIAIGINLEIPMEKCIQGISQFELTKKRMDVIELKNGVYLHKT